MFKKPFSFEGRVSRPEYVAGQTIAAIIYAPFIITLMMRQGSSPGIFIWVPLVCICLMFSFAQGAKRCHDLGKSGWWQLNPFYYLWMLFGDGEIGANEYGEDPSHMINSLKKQ